MLRNISFAILVAATVLSFFMRERSTPVESVNEMQNRMEERQIDLVFTMTVNEAILMQVATPEEADATKSVLISQIESLGQQLPAGPNVEVQRLILLDYIGEKTQSMPVDDATEYGRDFIKLFRYGRALPEDSILFDLATAPLVRLKNLAVQNRTEDYEELERQLKIDAAAYRGTLLLISGLVITVIFTGIFVTIRFFIRRPAAAYGPMIGRHSALEVRLLIESAIIYLFLMFAAGPAVAEMLHPDYAQYFQIIYLPVIFAGTLVYFFRQAGPSLTRQLFLIDNKESGEIGAVATVEDIEAAREESGETIDLTRRRVPGTGESGAGLVLHETIRGIAGWCAVFPFAMLSFFAVGSFVDTNSARFAHPIVFELEDRFATVFILAVFIVPLLEEVVFRGWIYGYLRSKMRTRWAALITGMLFAVLHPQGWIALPYLTLLGAGLCVIREYTRTLIPVVTAHTLVNFLAVTVAGQVY